jgi:hypothetical protein
MNKLRFTLSAIVVLTFAVAWTPGVAAQSLRTFVSTGGNDANPCSRDLPCRSISQALTQTTEGGEVVVLDSGDYEPFAITQSVTVQAAPGVYAGITSAANIAVRIYAGATDIIVLRGLTLNGPDGHNGIFLIRGGALHVENLVINGFYIGINASGYPGGVHQLFVKDTIIRNGRTGGGFTSCGISIGSSGPGEPNSVMASIDHCRFEKSDYGVFAEGIARVTIRDSIAAGCYIGFRIHAVSAAAITEMNLENCLATGNVIGIRSGPSRGQGIIRVSNSTITSNGTGLVGPNIVSRGNNTVEGNTTNGSFTGTFSPK